MIIKGYIKCEALRVTDINAELHEFLRGYSWTHIGQGSIEFEQDGHWQTVDPFDTILKLPDTGQLMVVYDTEPIDELIIQAPSGSALELVTD